MLSKRITLSALIVAIAALAAAPAFAQDKGGSKGDRVATVNGVAIPKARVDAVVKAQTQGGQVQDSPELRASVRDRLITSEIIAQEAVKRGMAKNADVQVQMDLARQQVLAGAFVQDFLKRHQPSDADIKREYDTIKAQLGDKEYNVRHILVDKVEEANDALAKLKKGDKFEDVAKAMSKDPGSKEKGGELGWAALSTYVKPFSDAVAKLKKGEYTTEPVQTQYGYHIIKLEDVRDLKLPAMDEVKPQIVQRIQGRLVDEEIKSLRDKAKVE
jgi:peptidyl-prolyl cis-trans isomerase C